MPTIQPPVPYSDFSLDDQLFPADNSLFPFPDLELDNSLLSSAETNSIFGFLDNFDWEFDPVLPPGLPVFTSSQSDPSITTCSPPPPIPQPLVLPPSESQTQPDDRPKSAPSPPPHHNHTTRTKPLLSTPQKRLNHIMSEQKRRNAIRDGYATLTNMLAPAGAPLGSGIPTRGRPKGSGIRGRAACSAKGKSGVLFRAVEYCRWLEEGCESLRKEVERLEIAAGAPRHIIP
ncbi:hypothetical protein BU17DRAFT_52678 [Hysterangium stoloniferum]|nr:hypothetical protein BU17DRAFT_52678 [Hysterangium stoloniferum]